MSAAKNPIFAFAVNEKELLAPTLGTAVFLLLLSREGGRTMKIPVERLGRIPALLSEYHAELLFCGGIGNCVRSLIESSGIQLEAGCCGQPAEVLDSWLSGTLIREKACSCTDAGRTCGSCPGKY